MIEFREAELFSVLPGNLKEAETAALSAAVQKGIGRIRLFSRAAPVYAAVSELPEEVLNLLALELRVQYYSPGAPRKQREFLIRQAIAWYLHGGTPRVLNEYLETLYQGGTVEEWHQYQGKPYFFRAYVTVGEEDYIGAGEGKEIRERIGAYKNVRSWLDALILKFHAAAAFPIETDSRLEMISEFYPRRNWAFLCLDGSWQLNGACGLYGYREPEQPDLYPARLSLAGSAECRAQIGGGLCVEKDLWRLDGTYGLDGEKMLDAEIIEYEELL